MGRATQFFDYINREPDKFSIDLIKFHYTHFEITGVSKAVRREYRKGLRNQHFPPTKTEPTK